MEAPTRMLYVGIKIMRTKFLLKNPVSHAWPILPHRCSILPQLTVGFASGAE